MLPPTASPHAQVTVPELGTLEARLIEVAPGHVRLKLLRRPTTELMLWQYDASLNVRTPGKGLAFAGVLKREGSGGGLTFLFEPSRSAGAEQRREAVRVQASVPLTLTRAEGLLTPFATQTTDLSVGGALIEDPIGLPLDVPISCTLALPDGRPALELEGSIVRAVGDDRRGLRFEDVEPAAQRRIARFLLTRQISASRSGERR